MNTFLAALAAGLLVSTLCPVLPAWPAMGLGALVATAGLWVIVRYLPQRSARFAGRAGLGLCLGLLGGLVQGHQLMEQRWPDERYGDTVTFHACVDGFVSTRGQAPVRRRWPLRVRSSDDPDVSPGMRLRLSEYDPAPGPMPRPGDCFRFEATLRFPWPLRSPGATDFTTTLTADRIAAVGTVRQWQPLTRPPAPGLLSRWRRYLSERLSQVTGSGPPGAILRTLVLGDDSRLSPEAWAVFERTGSIHLMVISGLHLGLVATLGGLGVRGTVGLVWARLGGQPNLRWLTMTGSLLSAWGYAALTGASVPVIRAGVMLTVALLVLSLARRRSALEGWLWAAVVVLAWNPVAAHTAGFWLSFGAVGILLLLFRGRLGMPAWWRSWPLAQIGLWLGMLVPLTLWLRPVAVYGALVNVWLVPWMTLVVWAGLIGVAVDMVHSGLANILWVAAESWLHMAWQGLRIVSEWPGALWYARLSGEPWAVLAVALGAGCLLWPVVPGHRVWLAGGLLLPLLCPGRPSVPAGALDVQVMDVGQGQAVLLQTAHHALLYDTGPGRPDAWNAGEGVVLPLLRRRGVDKLDRLMISHWDRDHTGGLTAVREALPVGQWMAPDISGQGMACRAGQQWQWDGVRFAVLHPASRSASHSDNDRSCVLKVSTAHHSLLLAGDIERRAEYAMVYRDPDALKADIVLVPHHGSTTSSSWPWGKRVRPTQAIISAGAGNRFGHPRPAIVRRWRILSARPPLVVWQTGTLSLRLPATDRPWTQHARGEALRRYWHPQTGPGAL